jgi:hypothetical protein
MTDDGWLMTDGKCPTANDAASDAVAWTAWRR